MGGAAKALGARTKPTKDPCTAGYIGTAASGGPGAVARRMMGHSRAGVTPLAPARTTGASRVGDASHRARGFIAEQAGLP